MIAQKNRLKKADFERLFKNGNKAYSPYCNLRYAANGLDYCRFAVIVSNKISKKATVRNKLRRRIKAVIVDNLSDFSGHFDIVITVLPPLKETDFSETRNIFVNLLKKYKLLK